MYRKQSKKLKYIYIYISKLAFNFHNVTNCQIQLHSGLYANAILLEGKIQLSSNKVKPLH